MLPGLASLAGFKSITPATVSFHDGDGSTIPFSATMDIGTAASNRRVIVAISVVNSGGTVTSFGSPTVAGQSCRLCATLFGAKLSIGVFITDQPVTSGTSATVAFSPDAGFLTMAHTYAVYGVNPIEYDKVTVEASNPSTTAVDIPGGGVLFAVSSSEDVSSLCTWTGVTEGFEGFLGLFRISTGTYTTNAFETGRTVTASWSINDGDVLAVVSWEAE